MIVLKYYDIVDVELFNNYDLNELKNIFNKLNINKIFITKLIKTKEDINNFKKLNLSTKSSNLVFEKIFLLEDLRFISFLKKENIFVCPKDINELNRSLKNKNIIGVYNPIFDKLCFDEGACNLCKINNIKIIVNLNSFKYNTYKTIKQYTFIFNILQMHKIDIMFGSFAKEIKELIDPKISRSFLKNFNFEEDILNKFYDEKICLKKE